MYFSPPLQYYLLRSHKLNSCQKTGVTTSKTNPKELTYHAILGWIYKAGFFHTLPTVFGTLRDIIKQNTTCQYI